MSIDFLGVEPDNYIVEEVNPTPDLTYIIPKRGFFFGMDVILYDEDGGIIDEDGYNFDLPMPDISSRINRMLFGRILINSRVKVHKLTYRAVYSEDDNRYNDIILYNAQNPGVVSFDYYSHLSKSFKTGINTLEGSDLHVWLGAMDKLIKCWRSRNIAHDVILDHIDEVFTRGILRSPDSIVYDDYHSGMFITVGDTGSSITLNEWSVQWVYDGNIFDLDYSQMNSAYITRLNTLNTIVATKSSMDLGYLDTTLTELLTVDTVEDIPVKSIGTNPSNDIIIKNGEITFSGIVLPEQYTGLGTKIKSVDSKLNINRAVIDNIKVNDSVELRDIANSTLVKLRDGYDVSDFKIGSGKMVITPNGTLWDYLTDNEVKSQLVTKGLTGTPVSYDSYQELKDSLVNISVPYSNPDDIGIHDFPVGYSLTNVLVGMMLVKRKLNHRVQEHISIEDIL